MNVLLIAYDIQGKSEADEKNRTRTLETIKRLAGNEDDYRQLSESAYALKTESDTYTVWCEFVDTIDYAMDDRVWVVTLSKPFAAWGNSKDWLMKNIPIGEDAEEML